MSLFKNKYRIESTRLPNWDYGSAGYYFVTICTKGRDAFFGEIIKGEMGLSRIGEIVSEEWLKTAEIRPNVKIDAWVVMPNHVHLIVVITHKINAPQPEARRRITPERETPQRGVSTRRTDKALEKWTRNTLGSIIGQFKGKCTKRILEEGFVDFEWQTRFYDRILRSDESLHKARVYIAVNPENWDNDKENLAGLFM